MAEIQREQEGTTPPSPVLTLPSLNDWSTSKRRPLPPEDHGFSVAYVHPAAPSVTFYQFTRGLASIPEDLESREIQGKMDRSKFGIEQAVQLGLWESAEETDQGVVSLGVSPQQVLWSRYALTVGGEEALSDTYVWSHENAFLKLRCTCRPEDSQEAMKALLTAFGNACK